MVGWHHQLHEHEFEQALEVGDGQVCCSPWGPKGSATTEQQQQKVIQIKTFALQKLLLRK